MGRKFWWVLIIGVLLRLILAASSYHSDIAALDFAGRVMASGHILNFYDFLSSLPKNDPILKIYPPSLFNYPPAIYFFFVGPSLLASLTGQSVNSLFIFDVQKVLGNFQLNLHLLLLKLPYLIFDLPIAFLLMRFFDSPRKKFLAFTFWLLNPVNLYVTYLVGQFDIIPTFFVVAALTLRKRLFWSAILLGIGASFKIYPLFLLIFLALLAGSFTKRLLIILLGVLPYFLTFLPFLPSPGFRSTALLANQTLKSLYAQIPLSGGESIILFPAFLILFYLIFLYQKTNLKFLWQRFFLILLLFFIFTHYHPQWFLWLTPFFILDLIQSNFKNTLPQLLSLLSFIGLLFFFDPGLTTRLFSPVFPVLYDSPSLWGLLRPSIDPNFIRSVLQTLFVGGALYLIYYYFPKDQVLKS